MGTHTLESSTRFTLNAMRRKHGFEVVDGERGSTWSQRNLDKIVNVIPTFPAQNDSFPRNADRLDWLKVKFEIFGFDWETYDFVDPNGNRRFGVRYINPPTYGRRCLSIADMALVPLEKMDGYESAKKRFETSSVGKQAEHFTSMRKIMEGMGIGYKGLAGISWLPGHKPLELPSYFMQDLQRLAESIFVLYDVVGDLFGTDPELTRLLQHKLPGRIPNMVSKGKVLKIRPDIVVLKEDGRLRPVVTELESAPAGIGMTHSMEMAYGLEPSVINTFAKFLNGRDLVIFATHEWSEYIFDLAVMIRALRERGINAKIVFDRSLETIHELVQSNWKCPADAPAHVHESWNTDFIGRLQKHGFNEFVSGSSALPTPENIGSAVVYRFGYFDNFSQETLDAMAEWEKNGATLMNPLSYYLENKALMAAAWIPSVMDEIRRRSPEALKTLHRCVARTQLLGEGLHGFSLDDLTRDRKFWLTKYGAWDGDNKSWGSRSIIVGSQSTDTTWRTNLQDALERDHPVVAQHVINSTTYDIEFVDESGIVRLLNGGKTRLTPFFFRGEGDQAMWAGAMMTLRAGTLRIHGATDAVEVPAISAD